MNGCLVLGAVRTFDETGRLLLHKEAFLVAMTCILASFIFFFYGVLMKKFLNPLAQKKGFVSLDVMIFT